MLQMTNSKPYVLCQLALLLILSDFQRLFQHL